MTDNEIIKALECCSYATSNKDCEKCPYYPDEECVKKQCTDILDLINRQKAEIERLTKERDFYKAPSSLLAKGIEQIKAEAIKEFAKRLTDTILDKSDRSLDNPNGNDYFISDVIEDIDNLVKEMVGENDG